MRKVFGVLVAVLLYYGGIVRLFRWRMRRAGKRLVILNYHHAGIGNLRAHLVYLRRHYRILHLEEALRELYSEHVDEDQRTLAAITFDDGYRDSYTCALALARELQVPITVFIVPGYIDSGEHFWWFESRRLVTYAQVDEVTLDDVTYHLGEQGVKDRLTQLIDERLRNATSVTEREDFIKSLRQLLRTPAGATIDGGRGLPLTWGEVLKMQESGLVSFGAHTVHHPVLSYLKEPEELRYEVEESRHIIAQHLGRQVQTFAYPIGQSEHINDEVIEAVRKAGYAGAVSTFRGINSPANDPFLLHRVVTDVKRHWLVLAAETSGLWGNLAPLWKSILGK